MDAVGHGTVVNRMAVVTVTVSVSASVVMAEGPMA